jgi:transcriptional regulator with XRE-family HTH domain
MTVGERIKTIRKSKHMTQKDLAYKIGVAANSIARYEEGRRQVSVSILERIANVLDNDICFFFGKEEKHAKWNINPDGYYPYCSHCKEEPPSGIMTKHCPNCGARMDLKE